MIVVKNVLCLAQVVFSYVVLHRIKIRLVVTTKDGHLRSVLFRQPDGVNCVVRRAGPQPGLRFGGASNIFKREKFLFLLYVQIRNQLGTSGGAKSFPRGAQIFELCPIFFNYVQHIFSQGAKNILGGFAPLRPLVTGLCMFKRIFLGTKRFGGHCPRMSPVATDL